MDGYNLIVCVTFFFHLTRGGGFFWDSYNDRLDGTPEE